MKRDSGMITVKISFADFTKTYAHVNTLLGPPLGTLEGFMQVQGLEALSVSSLRSKCTMDGILQFMVLLLLFWWHMK